MHYEVIASANGSSLSAVDVVHKGLSTRWLMGTYTRFKISDPNILFKEVNEFWKAQTEVIQDRIWLVYWNIFRIVDDPLNQMTQPELDHAILKKNRDLFNLYDEYLNALNGDRGGYDEQSHINITQRKYIGLYLAIMYKYFTANDSDKIIAGRTIVYASTMMDKVAKPVGSPEEDDGGYPETGRTHTRQDYNNLASLAIRLRPMLPIFGHCMQVFQDLRKTSMKESSIISMLNATDVVDMPSIAKLLSFMEASLKQFKAATSTILNGGIGTGEAASWLVAKALFRRVAPGEIDSNDGVSSIVTNIFNYIERSVFESTNRYFGPVHQKSRPDEGGKSGRADDGQSLLETMGSREEITRGRRRMINVMADKMRHAYARKIDPTIPLELVDRCCHLTAAKLAADPHKVHDGLTRWVMSSAAPHHNVDYLRREEMFIYMGITQAILEHWGYTEFAAIMASHPSVSDNVLSVAALWASDSFSQEVQTEMVKTFPYTQSGGRKTASLEESNVGLRDARAMATMISVENWLIDDPYYSDRVNKDLDGYISFPPGFTNKIGQLLIRCCQGTW